jgi:hypothetical protein
MMRRLIVLGDSHVVALAQGYEALEPRGVGFDGEVLFLKLFDGPDNLFPFFRADDDRIGFLDERVAAEVSAALGHPELRADDPHTVYALSMGVMTTLMVRLPDWKHAAPAAAAAFLEKKRLKRQLVSEAVVQAIALDQQKHVLAFVEAAGALGLKCLIVAAPPLRADERATGRNRDIRVLLEVDRISRAVLTDAFTRLGAPVVQPPYEALLDGLLRPDLRRIAPRDTHHGNGAYGALMLPRVIEAARRLAGAAEQGGDGLVLSALSP